jgi:tetratricopeptide (TPR) repeat protein
MSMLIIQVTGRSTLASAIIAALLLATRAAAQLPASLDPSGAWFQPSLELDEDAELCGALLDTGVRDFFAASAVQTDVAAWSPLLEAVRVTPSTGPVRPMASTEDPIALVRAGPLPADESTFFAELAGGRMYVAQTSRGGCGGRCETMSYHASTRPWGEVGNVYDPESYRRLGATTLTVPRYAHHWLKTADGRYYIGYRGGDFEAGREALLLVKLTGDGSWQNTCVVRTHPGELAEVDNGALRRALTSVRALDAAAGKLAGEDGDCGTLRALSWVNSSRARALEEALYKPWSWLGRGAPPDGGDALPPEVERWAALGVFERHALESYREQRAETLDELADFYAEQFRWSRSEARSVAESVIATVADQSFHFPATNPVYYDRGAAIALRRAILERRPLEEIRSIPASVGNIDGDDDQREESLLSVAVEYPDALAYLLERGANPNRPNAFGKTPLMYAAQHNAVASAKLLLDVGADPNAATVQPSDNCYYSLNRTSVTALHYAVRYASVELVELLVDRGAAVFAKVRGDFGEPEGQLPLDWLRRYAAADSKERNPNIGIEDVPALAARLATPDVRALEDIALDLAVRAEAEYGAADAAAAYETLRLALEASPNHPRALSDMSLIALRAGRPAEAASAAWLLANSATDRKLVANAWFNLGLACEALERPWDNVCPAAAVFPFLRSWVTEPTQARADKLRAVLDQRASCIETRAEGVYRYVLPAVQRFSNAPPRRMYVTHPPAANLASRILDWRPLDKPTASVRILGHWELGDVTVTELESPGDVDYPVAGPNFACDTPPPAR